MCCFRGVMRKNLGLNAEEFGVFNAEEFGVKYEYL